MGTAIVIGAVVLTTGGDEADPTVPPVAASGSTATDNAGLPEANAGSPEDRWVLSSDQARITEEFGLPGTFTLVIGEDANDLLEIPDPPSRRFEYWDYYDMGVRFVFLDGAILGTRSIDVLGSEVGYPAISPEWFAAGMTPDEVTAVMGMSPSRGGDLIPGVLGAYQMFIWDGVLAGSFIDGWLVSVETAPVREVG